MNIVPAPEGEWITGDQSHDAVPSKQADLPDSAESLGIIHDQ
jgi:hypothetical protein